MAVMKSKEMERAEISMLLPWYVAGTLSAAETRRVAAAIENDPELAARLEDARLEASQTLLLNEALGVPSRAAADKLFAAIDAKAAAHPRAPSRLRVGGWLTETIASLRPRTVAFAGAAAALVIVLQAGLIAGNFLAPSTSTYQTATAPSTVTSGRQVLISFAPEATVGEIEAMLREVGGTIIEAPYEGGLFRVRIGPENLDQAGLDRAVETLRKKAPAVRFVAPAS